MTKTFEIRIYDHQNHGMYKVEAVERGHENERITHFLCNFKLDKNGQIVVVKGQNIAHKCSRETKLWTKSNFESVAKSFLLMFLDIGIAKGAIEEVNTEFWFKKSSGKTINYTLYGCKLPFLMANYEHYSR